MRGSALAVACVLSMGSLPGLSNVPIGGEMLAASVTLAKLGQLDVPSIPPDGGVFMVASCTDGFGFMDPSALTLNKIRIEAPQWFAFSAGVYVSSLNKIVLVPLSQTPSTVKILDVATWEAVDVAMPPLLSGYHGGAEVGNGTVLLTPGGSKVCSPQGGFIDFWEIISFDIISQTVASKTRLPEWHTCFGKAVLVPDGGVVLVPWFVGAGTTPSVGRFFPESGKVSRILLDRHIDHEAYWFHDAVLTPDGALVFTPLDVDFIGILFLNNETFTTVDISHRFAVYRYKKFGGGAYAAATGEVIMAPYRSRVIGIFNPRTTSFETFDPQTLTCSYLSAVATSAGQIVFAPWQCPLIVIFTPESRNLFIIRLSDDFRRAWNLPEQQGYFSAAFFVPGPSLPIPPQSQSWLGEFLWAGFAVIGIAIIFGAIFCWRRCRSKRRIIRPGSVLGPTEQQCDISLRRSSSHAGRGHGGSLLNTSRSGALLTRGSTVTWETRLHQVRKCVRENDVASLFNSTGRGYFDIVRVEMIESSAQQLRACSDTLAMLDQRRGDRLRGGAFGLGWDVELDEGDRRSKMELLDYLSTQFMIAPWASVLESRIGSVLVMPVWLGAGEATIDRIASLGFASLTEGSRLTADNSADPGWFGKGRYNSIEASLSCRNACAIAEGERVVLLSLAVVGCAYPITPGRTDFPHGPLPPQDPTQCTYHGGSFRDPCDTHIVGVDKDTMRCTSPSLAHYHKVVSARDEQLLPLAKVFFQASEPWSPPALSRRATT